MAIRINQAPRCRRGRGRGRAGRMACEAGRSGPRGPDPGRGHDRQGDGRDSLAGRRQGAVARRRDRRRCRGRQRIDPHRGSRRRRRTRRGAAGLAAADRARDDRRRSAGARARFRHRRQPSPAYPRSAPRCSQSGRRAPQARSRSLRRPSAGAPAMPGSICASCAAPVRRAGSSMRISKPSCAAARPRRLRLDASPTPRSKRSR